MEFVEITAEKLLGPLNDVEQKNAPAKLYVCGNVGLFKLPRVSIVGTRQPSAKGVELANSIARYLVAHHVVVVSGLAEGIDTVAHTTAMDARGKTIAVLGTALDQYYPKQNELLQRQIMSEQLAVSQFEPGMRGSKSSFPARNRTMALLSDATIIVEAGEKSGTEHQGWEAVRLGRPLFISKLVADKNYEWVNKLCHYGADVLESTSSEAVFDVIPMVPNDAIEQVAL